MRSSILLGFGMLFAVSFAAHAATLTESFTQTYTNARGTIEDTSGIALFDPALGTLNSVTQTVTGNIIFTQDVPGEGFYELGVNGPLGPLGVLTEYQGGLIDVSATEVNPAFAESTDKFGQQYVIEPFDFFSLGGSVTSLGPVTDSFTFNYTPAVAATPEPSSFALFGTGLLGMSGLVRRRLAQAG